MKYIYVVLIESYTGLGKILKKFTGYRYEHIAVSLDKSLTEFYSFSRKQHHHPFKAGFMKEYRDYYAFEEYKKFYSKIFAIPVTEEKYDQMDFNYNKVKKISHESMLEYQQIYDYEVSCISSDIKNNKES